MAAVLTGRSRAGRGPARGAPGDDCVSGRSAFRGLLLALVLALLPGLRSPLAGQEPIRLNLRIPKNPKEIRLAADAVAVMDEGGRKYYRLLGNAFVEQNVARIRAKNAIVRV